MRVREITLREIHLKLLFPFETSMDRVTDRRIILVEADVDGVPLAIAIRQIPPGRTGAENPEDAVDVGVVGQPRSAGLAVVAWLG